MDSNILASVVGVVGTIIGSVITIGAQNYLFKKQESDKKEVDKQIRKKLCSLIQYQLADIASCAGDLNRDYNDQKYLKNMFECKLDVGINHTLLLNYLETSDYRAYLDLINAGYKLQKKVIRHYDNGTEMMYSALQNMMNESGDIAEKARSLQLRFVKITDDINVY